VPQLMRVVQRSHLDSKRKSGRREDRNSSGRLRGLEDRRLRQDCQLRRGRQRIPDGGQGRSGQKARSERAIDQLREALGRKLRRKLRAEGARVLL
jgi:hypothetical protein